MCTLFYHTNKYKLTDDKLISPKFFLKTLIINVSIHIINNLYKHDNY